MGMIDNLMSKIMFILFIGVICLLIYLRCNDVYRMYSRDIAPYEIIYCSASGSPNTPSWTIEGTIKGKNANLEYVFLELDDYQKASFEEKYPSKFGKVFKVEVIQTGTRDTFNDMSYTSFSMYEPFKVYQVNSIEKGSRIDLFLLGLFSKFFK